MTCLIGLLMIRSNTWNNLCANKWLVFCPVGSGAVEYTDYRGVRPPTNECSIYDTKKSDGEIPVMLELWEIQSTPSSPSLPGPLWSGVVAPDRVLSMG